MLLPRKWVLSLGLLATAPGFALAGPFDGKTKSDAPAERPAAKTTARPEAGRSNDQIAQDIAKAMKAAGLKGKGIQIVVQDGEVTLTGQILDSAQLAKATQVASRVPGIENVNNELTPIQGGAPAHRQPGPTAADSAGPVRRRCRAGCSFGARSDAGLESGRRSGNR